MPVGSNDAIYLFLTDLRDQRQTRKRLLDFANECPEMVLAYLDALPENWDSAETKERDLLIELRQLALAALEQKQQK